MLVAIGDISLQFLTSDSKLVETELTERIIRADIFKASKHARVSIGIAEGTYKKDIIHSALSASSDQLIFYYQRNSACSA